MSVKHLLITAPFDNHCQWHRSVAALLLDHERRGNTVSYTCMSDDFDFAMQQAAECDVTIEETVHRDGEELYELRHQGSHGMRWETELKRLREVAGKM